MRVCVCVCVCIIDKCALYAPCIYAERGSFNFTAIIAVLLSSAYSWGVIFCRQLVSLCCLELLLRYAVCLFFVRLFNVIGNFWQGVWFLETFNDWDRLCLWFKDLWLGWVGWGKTWIHLWDCAWITRLMPSTYSWWHLLSAAWCSFKCGIDYHAPTDCETIKKWLTKCADDSETANYISAHTKDVSSSSMAIQSIAIPLYFVVLCCPRSAVFMMFVNWYKLCEWAPVLRVSFRLVSIYVGPFIVQDDHTRVQLFLIVLCYNTQIWSWYSFCHCTESRGPSYSAVWPTDKAVWFWWITWVAVESVPKAV